MRHASLFSLVLAFSLTVLLLPAGATYPGPDGELFFTRDTDGNGASDPAVIAAAAGGGERVVQAEPGPGFNPQASPDGRELLYSSFESPVVRQSVAGGRVVEVVPAAQSFGLAEWSPDGTQVVYLNRADGWSVIDVDGTGDRALNPATSAGGHEITWSTDGFLYQAEGQRVIRIDPTSGATTEIAVSGLQINEDAGIDSSPDGARLAVICALDGDTLFGRLCILGTDGSLVQAISPDDRRMSDPLFSPSGTRVAFSMPRTDFSAEDMFATDLAGGGLQQIVTDGRAASWGRTPESAPEPLEEPPPPPTNNTLAMGGFDGDPTTTERADYTDPTLFAVAVSQARFAAGTAEHAVVSRDDAFPDSLAGAALTGQGPLLYTATAALPSATADEISRAVGAGGTVYLLGGTAAISQAVEGQLAADFDVRRLAGDARVETSVAVAREVVRLRGSSAFAGGDGLTIAVARAGGPADNPTAGWADSVSSGAWTAANRIPTVVTNTSSVHPAVAEFLEDVVPGRTVLLGGTGALSAAVEAAVPNPQRIAGASRADTARLIAEELIGQPDDGSREAVAINGFRTDGWLFGLPAAGLAGDAQGSMALVGGTLPPETAAQLCSPDDIDVLIAGGFAAVSAEAAAEIDAAPAC